MQFQQQNAVQGTGPGAGLQIWDPEIKGMSANQATMTGYMRVPGSGATSDFEQRLYARGAPSIDNTREANDQIIKGIDILARASEGRQFFFERYAQERGTLLGAEEAYQQSPEFKQLEEQERAIYAPAGANGGAKETPEQRRARLAKQFGLEGK